MLNKVGYFQGHSLTMSTYQVETFSATQKIDINSKLPFVIETKGFGDNFTKYKLLDRSDNQKVIHEGAILLRNSDLVEINNKYYAFGYGTGLFGGTVPFAVKLTTNGTMEWTKAFSGNNGALDM